MSSVTMNVPTWLLVVVMAVIVVGMVLQVASLWLQRAIKRLDRDCKVLEDQLRGRDGQSVRGKAVSS